MNPIYLYIFTTYDLGIFNLGTSNRARLVRLQWLTWISLLFDTKIDFCLTNELCFIYLRPTFLTAKVNSIFSVFVLVLESFIAVINLSSLYGKQIHAYKKLSWEYIMYLLKMNWKEKNVPSLTNQTEMYLRKWKEFYQSFFSIGKSIAVICRAFVRIRKLWDKD